MKPTLKYFILLLLAVALLPYFIICFYAFPFADDFCFGWTASENVSFTKKILDQYLYWNGRYTTDVLVNLHPLISGKIIYYQLLVFVSLLAAPVVLYFFVQEVLRNSATNVKPLYVSLFITLFYLTNLPNLTEGVYWVIGIINYHFGNLLFVVQLTLFLKSFWATGNRKVLLQVTSLLLMIAAIGFNEIGAMLIPAFYCCMALHEFKVQNLKFKVWVWFGAVAVMASAFVFFSPGNFVRTHEFENRFDILHSLFYSSLQTVRFLGKWVFNVPFFLLSLVIAANAERIKIKTVDYRLLLAALLFVVFIGSFFPYFATGVLGQHRTINFVFFFFILLGLLLLLSVSEKFLLHEKLLVFKNEKVIAGLILVSIFLMMITGNGIKMISDFKHDNFRKYETAFAERQKEIIQNPDVPIEKLSVIPKTFTVVDVRSDSTWWVDKCMKKYYLTRR